MTKTEFWGMLCASAVMLGLLTGVLGGYFMYVATKVGTVKAWVCSSVGSWVLSVAFLVAASVFASLARDGSGGLGLLAGFAWFGAICGVLATTIFARDVVENYAHQRALAPVTPIKSTRAS